MKITLYVLALICVVGAYAQSNNDIVYDEGIRVVSFEPMHYPNLARTANRQGAVVVRIQLDPTGKVTSANAISGWKMLIPDAIANSEKWRFRNGTGNTAIIVYEFTLIDGHCSENRGDLFTFIEPNVARVMSCRYDPQP